MLWTIFVILLVLWLLGLVSSYTLGGYIHLLLVIAIVVLLIRVIQGRKPLQWAWSEFGKEPAITLSGAGRNPSYHVTKPAQVRKFR
jgi:hypothetical protein